MYSEPLNQANQIIPKTTANSTNPTQRDVLGEVVRRLRDHRHVDEVVEQLEVADRPVLEDLAVRPRRADSQRLNWPFAVIGSGTSRSLSSALVVEEGVRCGVMVVRPHERRDINAAAAAREA